MHRTPVLSARAWRLAAAASCCLAISISPASAQDLIDADAASVLASMSGYLGGLQSFSADYDVEIDTITEAGEKLQFSSSGEIWVQRPDKLHATREGARVDAEFILDGENLSIVGHQLNGYVQLPATSIDEAVDSLRDNTGFDAPGADLLSSTPLDPDVTDMVSGVHVGMAYVDGTEVHHLAFRGKTVDWQLWVQAGDEPLPLKYVITSKWDFAAPEYTLRLSNWNVAPEIDAAQFTFTPPAGAKVFESIDVDGTGQFINEAE